MELARRRLENLGVGVPDILVPNNTVDLEKWAVVACDQYTSEKEYWQAVDLFVGDAPSTLRLIFPEAYLEDPDPAKRITAINAKMAEYLQRNLFKTYEDSFFLVHRETGSGPGRWGLIVALDLEHYDYAKDSRTFIRATEGTILSRIPPRKLIRKDAPLELPHILVLISDPEKTVIEPLSNAKNSLEFVYETALMKNGGRLTAYRVHGEALLSQVAQAFEKLHAQLDASNPLLFAMGDGNHSLATAKSCWEDIKQNLSPAARTTHPARFALVELENIFDPGLEFEPIHRVLFNLKRETFLSYLSKACEAFTVTPCQTLSDLMARIEKPSGTQDFGFVDSQGLAVIGMAGANATIAAGTLQSVIDSILSNEKVVQVDYIHGENITDSIGSKPGNIGLFLPALDKNEFFDTIVKDGALPRKTFSMGEAHEKRFYMEARRIK
ncbi:MAG: DUF1015 domain-containing protein [Spirochaetae bacterium HGW-Spirochaetae-8]|nr:MAG: DUF1015 domain-containing protein [Spirochaetae bacterium HGW-Spirochaetae-8]